jgi:hypothetical protein
MYGKQRLRASQRRRETVIMGEGGKMTRLDEQILRCYFRLEEFQMQRLRFESLFHPEKFDWKKKGAPPKISETKKIRIEELKRIGFDEAFYQRMLEGEENEKEEMGHLVELHPLWEWMEPIAGWGFLTGGKYIAVSGDITRTDTMSSFWKGMGLDIVDGKAPRRIRGRTNVERKVPAMPHVTRIGEQIRKQMMMQNPFYQELYYKHKADYVARYPDRPPMFAHKHGLRIPQKVLYGCLWMKWRECYGLPAPLPYVFDILKHDSGRMITIEDFYRRD